MVLKNQSSYFILFLQFEKKYFLNLTKSQEPEPVNEPMQKPETEPQPLEEKISKPGAAWEKNQEPEEPEPLGEKNKSR